MLHIDYVEISSCRRCALPVVRSFDHCGVRDNCISFGFASLWDAFHQPSSWLLLFRKRRTALFPPLWFEGQLLGLPAMRAPDGTTPFHSQHDKDYLPGGSKLWKCPGINNRRCILPSRRQVSVDCRYLFYTSRWFVCSLSLSSIGLCHTIVFPWPFLIPLPGFRSHFQSRINDSWPWFPDTLAGYLRHFGDFLGVTSIFKKKIQFWPKSLGQVVLYPSHFLFYHQKADEQLVLRQRVDRVAWFRCWCSVILLQLPRIIASCPFYRFCQAADRASYGVHSVAVLSVTQFPAPLPSSCGSFISLSFGGFNFVLKQHYCLPAFYCRIFSFVVVFS